MANVKKEIDWSVVDELAALHCTAQEIVAFIQKTDMNIHYNTFDNHSKQSFGIPFGEYVKRQHEAVSKPKLRRLQWKTAEAGNAVMQIWLGKQYLHQSDKQEIENTNYEMPTVIVDDTEE